MKAGYRLWSQRPETLMRKSLVFISHQIALGCLSVSSSGEDRAFSWTHSIWQPPVQSHSPLTGFLCSLPQVSALRRLAKPMSERVAGRAGLKPPMLDSGAEVSASTTSSEAESGARSVSSIVRQWNRQINHFLGDHPAPAVNGTRPTR